VDRVESDFDVAWDNGRPADAERALRATLEDAGGRRPEVLTQIARAQGLQGHFAAAHETLDQAEEESDDPVIAVRCLLERGRLFHASGHPARARPHLEHALAAAQTYELDGYAVDAAQLMGASSRGAEALTWRERGIAMAEASGLASARARLGNLYLDLGGAYAEAGEPGQALGAFERALAWWAERDRPDQVRRAACGLALALRRMRRHQEALTALRSIAAEGGEHDSRVYEEIGENLRALDQPEQARAAFARAYALLSADPDLAARLPERLEHLRELSAR
jgi:tetratricopeptide (TPR) repeat protein